MWTPENIAALCTGIAGVVGAVTALVVALRQRTAVTALKAAQTPPGGSGTSTSAS